jgi:hypothetical protein
MLADVSGCTFTVGGGAGVYLTIVRTQMWFALTLRVPVFVSTCMCVRISQTLAGPWGSWTMNERLADMTVD